MKKWHNVSIKDSVYQLLVKYSSENKRTYSTTIEILLKDAMNDSTKAE